MGEPTPLAFLEASFEREARLDQSYVVLTVAASLIATLGLLADSAAVVIGAMLIAPWILPLRSASFAILEGRLALVGRALLTLAVGVGITVLTSAALGWVANLPVLGDEVLGRTTPNLLDLGIALVAGSIATYGRLKPEAVSSVAGTAIAVALVPPVCVLGLLLSLQQWEPARGAALLFAANLLGILSGGIAHLGGHPGEPAPAALPQSDGSGEPAPDGTAADSADRWLCDAAGTSPTASGPSGGRAGHHREPAPTHHHLG